MEAKSISSTSQDPAPISPGAEQSNPPAHYAYLDGVRAVAALYVVFHHAYLIVGAHLPFSDWLFYGHFAVDVFIVLSGFCLILPVAARNSLKGGYLEFLRRRARRILPPYYAAIGFSLVLLALEQVAQGERIALPVRSLLPSLLLIQDIASTYGIPNNAPLWSVALEFKIYFFLPLFAGWLIQKRHSVSWVLLASFVIGYGILLLVHLASPNLSFFYMQHRPPWYLFLFGMGVCAGWIATRTNTVSARRYLAMSLLPLALLVLLFQHYNQRVQIITVATHFYLFDAVVGAGTALLLLACHRGTVLTRLLSWRPLVFIGTFAYSIYLLHYPILLLLLRVIHLRFAASDGSLILLLLCAVGVPLVLLISYAFYSGVERPFMRKRRVESERLV